MPIIDLPLAELHKYQGRNPCPPDMDSFRDRSLKEEIYTRLGYVDIQHLAKGIRGEVLMATGLMDTICPPSTQFAIYNKIIAPKKIVDFPDYGHEEFRVSGMRHGD